MRWKDRPPAEAFPPDEGPTSRMPVVAPAKVSCPKCGGQPLLELVPVDVPGLKRSTPKPDLSKLGAYRYQLCDLCSDGKVTAIEAEAYRRNRPGPR